MRADVNQLNQCNLGGKGITLIVIGDVPIIGSAHSLWCKTPHVVCLSSSFVMHSFYWEIYGSDSKTSACSVGDLGSIPGLGRSSGEGNGNPLQYSCLENSMSLVGYSPWGLKESDTTEWPHFLSSSFMNFHGFNFHWKLMTLTCLYAFYRNKKYTN